MSVEEILFFSTFAYQPFSVWFWRSREKEIKETHEFLIKMKPPNKATMNKDELRENPIDQKKCIKSKITDIVKHSSRLWFGF